ncbi:hypothetical protein ABVT39_000168 [Epinephelus coioides]
MRIFQAPAEFQKEQQDFTQLPAQEYICYNVDTTESDSHHMYPKDFLNTLCPSGMPPHRITLKVGMVIMLLRNFDQQNGHCNASRYITDQILPHQFQELPSYHLTLRRKQSPVRPYFAMTVNKSQGQSLQRVGVFVTRDFFSHGHLYVATSRVGRSNSLRILALDQHQSKSVAFSAML